MKRFVSIVIVVCVIAVCGSAMAWDEYIADGSTLTDNGKGLLMWSISVDDWTIILTRNNYDDPTDTPSYTGLGFSSGGAILEWSYAFQIDMWGNIDYYGVQYKSSDVSSNFGGNLVYATPNVGAYHYAQHGYLKNFDMWLIPEDVAISMCLDLCEVCE